MVPGEFINRIKTQKYIDSDSLLKAFTEPSPVSIRINQSKWNRKPFNSKPVSWCNNGYYLKERPSYTLDPLFHAGCYYPQEASSMFLEQVIKQSSELNGNLKVLDLCAAPGGKSTHLSDIIGPDSLLIANDVIRSRAAILVETLTRWGSGNVLVTQNDPAAFARLPEYFDIILVDAPCSGEGMFRSDIAISEWSAGNTAHCSERQKRILMDVWPALKENGILVYSTCTFNPDENEENLKWLIGKKEAESIRSDISGFKGITEIDFEGIFGYGFYPDKVRGEGFFISAVRKTGIMQGKIHVRSHKKSNLQPDKNDIRVLERWTGFSKERALKWGDDLIAVPCSMEDYLQIFREVKIVKAGTKICTVKKNDYLPSHELALSQKLKKDAFPIEEVDLSVALAYMRRDNFSINSVLTGWNILTFNNVNLGFVKNIGNRFNNYFPVEWRIRMNLPEPGHENIIQWNR